MGFRRMNKTRKQTKKTCGGKPNPKPKSTPKSNPKPKSTPKSNPKPNSPITSDEKTAKRRAAYQKGRITMKLKQVAKELKKQEAARKRKEKKIEDEKKAQKLKEEQEERERKIQLARDHSTGSYESEYQDPDLKFIPSLSNSYELDSDGIRKPRWPSEDV